MMPHPPRSFAPPPLSGDSPHDPPRLPAHAVAVTGDDQAAPMVAAMGRFVQQGDAAAFGAAVAGYVHAARARGRAVEQVLATLNGLTTQFQGHPRGVEGHAASLRELVLQHVLRACYGDRTGTGQATAPTPLPSNTAPGATPRPE